MRFYRQDMQNVLLKEEVKTPIHIFDGVKLNEKKRTMVYVDYRIIFIYK